MRLAKIDVIWSEGLSDAVLQIAGSDRYIKYFGYCGSVVLNDAGREIRLEEGGTTLIRPGTIFRETHFGATGEFRLLVSEEALRQKLAGLIGEVLPKTLDLVPPRGFSDQAIGSMRHAISSLVAHIDTHGATASDIFVSEIEEFLIVQMLFANEHAQRDALFRRPPAIADRQLALAFDFIEANWMRTVLVEDIAKAAGVSVRSLFRSFQKTPSRTPMAHLKRVRLGHARAMLLSAETGTTVTEIVFACGFGNTGHFARDYRAQFGEMPSETLARGRRGER